MMDLRLLHLSQFCKLDKIESPPWLTGATIRTAPNMPNTNSTLRGNVRERRNRSLPRLVRANDVFCSGSSFLFEANLFRLQCIFFVCSCRIFVCRRFRFIVCRFRFFCLQLSLFASSIPFLFAANLFCLQCFPCGPSYK